jgi:(p)ppGpp synthase/HD superfamily hydrolase
MPYSKRFEEALLYANRLHADQHRKQSDIPYITHLLAVAALVAEYGGDEEQVIAALLHDSVEDQGGAQTLAEVLGRFGERVARIVRSCTDSEETPKPPWRQRKEAYLEHLPTAEQDELLVSAADKLHNARTIVADIRRFGAAAFDRFTGRKDGVLWYYRALVGRFEERGQSALVEELDRTVTEMERLACERQPESSRRPG